MTEILVVPHGGRWAVKDSPDAMPISEYETRDLAEAAARHIASQRGADVRVDESADPRAGANPEPSVEDRHPGQRGPDPRDARTGGAGGSETFREPQAGL